MLYTLSHATYDYHELTDLLQHLAPNDKLILWQDAVLLPLKYPDIFTHYHNHISPQTIQALEIDVIARGLLGYPLLLLSLSDFVTVTECYSPHIGL